MVSLTAYSQTSNKVLVERKKLEILLDSYFYDFPSCQRSLMASDSLNSIYKLSLAYSDSLNQIKGTKIELQSTQLDLWSKRYDNTNELHREQLNRATKKGIKLGSIITGIPAILLIIVLL